MNHYYVFNGEEFVRASLRDTIKDIVLEKYGHDSPENSTQREMHPSETRGQDWEKRLPAYKIGTLERFIDKDLLPFDARRLWSRY